MACSNIRFGAGVTREIGMVMDYFFFTQKLQLYHHLLTLKLLVYFYERHLY